MDRQAWTDIITENMRAAGTLRPFFSAAIGDLAAILSERDRVRECYDADENGPVLVYSNGNPGVNQYLKIWNELNAQALKYWNELGLTPAGLRKISEDGMKPAEVDPLAEVLNALGV